MGGGETVMQVIEEGMGLLWMLSLAWGTLERQALAFLPRYLKAASLYLFVCRIFWYHVDLWEEGQ